MVRVLVDVELRERLARGARAWAARFSWDAAAAEVAEAIDAVCGRAPQPATALASAGGLSLSLRSPDAP